MAMIDLNRVLNQSLSLRRSNPRPGRFDSAMGLSLRLAMSLLAIAFLVFPLIGRAQQLTATLTGVVTDSSGAVIPNATVTITNTSTNAIRTVQSDGSGSYSVSSLPAGTYRVNVSSAGFETFVANNVVLNVAEKRGLNIQLKTGATSTTVTVEAADDRGHRVEFPGRDNYRCPDPRARTGRPQLPAAGDPATGRRQPDG